MNKKRTNVVAYGGMIAALSIVLMLLTRVIPFMELALPAIAGVLLISAVVELGPRWAFVVYAAVGLLSLVLANQNGAAFYYILFFGHYTIVKSFVEHIHNKVLCWAAKLAIFNACAVAVYFAVLAFAGLPENALRYGLWVLLVLVNVAFILYDIALTRFVGMYFNRIRKIIGRDKQKI